MRKKKNDTKVAIKKRYLSGEDPKSIGDDLGLPAKKISNWVNREGWKKERQRIQENISKQAEADVMSLANLALKAAQKALNAYVLGQDYDAKIVVSALRMAWPNQKDQFDLDAERRNMMNEREVKDLTDEELFDRIKGNIGKQAKK